MSELARKLGIKPGHSMLLMNAPEGCVQKLSPLPEGANVKTPPQGMFDFVQLFVRNKAHVDAHASTAIRALKPGGLLWLCYRKKSSAAKADVTRDMGWDALYAAGFRPVSQIAIDEGWSALRFRPASEVRAKRA